MAECLNEEVWRQRSRRLAALNSANPDPANSHQIMAPKLFWVAKEGDVDQFIKALEDHCAKERVSLSVLFGLRSPCKNTLLHAAAGSGDNVKAIIEFVPSHLIYSKNSRGEMPLHIAARAGKRDAVKLLFPKKNTRDTDRNGNSALHQAVRYGHHGLIQELVLQDPNLLYCINKERKSPWCLAVEMGDLKVLRLLLEAQNDVQDQGRSESENYFGMSPVHVAIIHQRLDMLTEMWERKPCLFQLRDAELGTPLHLAAYKNYVDGVKFLMENCPTSALEQDKGTDGYLPIHVACMMNHVRIVKELLPQWPYPEEFLTGLGQNILHVAAKHGSTATVKYILKSPGFDRLINAGDFEGNTPLHLAALHCRPTVVLLARNGRVDNRLVNEKNMTALDLLEEDIKETFPPLGKTGA